MTMLPMGETQPLPFMAPPLQADNLPTFKRGGMFGGKANIGEILSAALNGYLAAGGNPAGQMGLQQLHQKRMMEQQRAIEEQEYNRRRQDQRSNFIFEQDYRSAHKPPEYGEFERALIASGVQPGTPQWAEMMSRRRDNMLDPIVNTPIGPVLRSSVTSAIQPPKAPVGRLTPIDEGGAGPSAPRPFPY